VYLVPKFMSKLKTKVQLEMKKGARVVVATYPFPDWAPATHYKNVYMYTIERKA
jgi:hypothetical protein